MGYIYILTNPLFKNNNIVKIGQTDRDPEERIQELNRETGVPAPFVCEAIFEFEKYKEVEKLLHTAFRGAGIHTHKESKTKEFFEIEPSKVIEVLHQCAEGFQGKQIYLDDESIYSPEEQLYLEEEEERKERRANLRFSELGIEPGAELLFRKDRSLKCKVIADGIIEFEGEQGSISNITLKILNERFNKQKTGVNGNTRWEYNGVKLTTLRDELETSN